MAKDKGTTVTPLDAQKRVLEALASQSIGKSPINANSVSESVNVVYQKNPAMESAEMQKPQAEYPSHLDGMMLRGGAMKGSIGYNPFEDYANVAMQRYNIEQQRLNNTLQRLPTPEFTTEYSTRQVQRGSEGQSDAYKAGQLDVARKELELMKEKNDAELGKNKEDIMLGDAMRAGVPAPALTKSAEKNDWNPNTVRNTLSNAVTAIKEAYPDAQMPPVETITLDGSPEDNKALQSTMDWITGYVGSDFTMPWKNTGIYITPKRDFKDMSELGKRVSRAMFRASNVTSGTAQPRSGASPQPQKVKTSPEHIAKVQAAVKAIEAQKKRWNLSKTLDGDTVIMTDPNGTSTKVRLDKGDAYESNAYSENYDRIAKQAKDFRGNKDSVLSRGKDAKRFTDSLLTTNNPNLDVRVTGKDKYGRSTGEIYINGRNYTDYERSLHGNKHFTKTSQKYIK